MFEQLGELNEGVFRAILVIFVLLVTLILERAVRSFARHKFNSSSLHIKIDHKQFRVLRHFISAIIYLAGIGTAIYLIPPLKTLSISLFASAGIMAVIIGFASQKTFANVIGGMFIVLFKPFKVGDVIKFSERIGEVEDITLRHTVIRDYENKRLIIPNSIMSEEIIENYNFDDEKICKWIDFHISYDSDIDKAMEIMKDEAVKHPDFHDSRNDAEKEAKLHPVRVKVIGFGDSSVILRAWVWAENPSASFRIGWDLNKSIKERFDKEGVEIPYPYRTIVNKKRKR